MFSTRFRTCFRDLAAAVFRTFLRRKRTEMQLYKPVRETIADVGKAGVARFDDEIRKSLLSSFGLAQNAFQRLPPAADLPAQTENRAKPKPAPDPGAEAERVAMLDALEAARLHAKANGYFMPRSVDYAMLSELFTLDKAAVTKGLVELGHAVSQGESENYVSGKSSG